MAVLIIGAVQWGRRGEDHVALINDNSNMHNKVFEPNSLNLYSLFSVSYQCSGFAYSKDQQLRNWCIKVGHGLNRDRRARI